MLPYQDFRRCSDCFWTLPKITEDVPTTFDVAEGVQSLSHNAERIEDSNTSEKGFFLDYFRRIWTEFYMLMGIMRESLQV